MLSPVCMTFLVLCFMLTRCLVNGVLVPGYSLSVSPFRDVPNIPFHECRKECMSRPICKAFNYRRHLGLCMLLDTDSSSAGSDPDPRIVYSEKIDWNQKTVSSTCETKCGQNQVCRLDGEVTLCQNEECDEPDHIVPWETRSGNMRQIGSKILHQLLCFVFDSGTFDTNNIQSTCNENGDWSIPSITCYENINSFVNYLGCYKDHADRTLSHGPHSDAGMTLTMCAQYCHQVDSHYVYFGLQYSSQCFCGSTFVSIGTSTACTSPCSGDSTITCGGVWASSVYTYT